jgi:hypothetical protein
MSGASPETVLHHSLPAPEPLRAPRRPSPCCSSSATDRSSLRAAPATWSTSSQRRWRCSTRGMPSHVSDEPRSTAKSLNATHAIQTRVETKLRSKWPVHHLSVLRMDLQQRLDVRLGILSSVRDKHSKLQASHTSDSALPASLTAPGAGSTLCTAAKPAFLTCSSNFFRSGSRPFGIRIKRPYIRVRSDAENQQLRLPQQCACLPSLLSPSSNDWNSSHIKSECAAIRTFSQVSLS